ERSVSTGTKKRAASRPPFFARPTTTARSLPHMFLEDGLGLVGSRLRLGGCIRGTACRSLCTAGSGFRPARRRFHLVAHILLRLCRPPPGQASHQRHTSNCSRNVCHLSHRVTSLINQSAAPLHEVRRPATQARPNRYFRILR